MKVRSTYNLKHRFRSCFQNNIYTLMGIFSFTDLFYLFILTFVLFSHVIQSDSLFETSSLLPDFSEV